MYNPNESYPSGPSPQGPVAPLPDPDLGPHVLPLERPLAMQVQNVLRALMADVCNPYVLLRSLLPTLPFLLLSYAPYTPIRLL